MKRLILDIDDTISRSEGTSYDEAALIRPIRERILEYKALGFDIIFSSSRNMRTFGGNLGKINKHTLPAIIDWLTRHDIPFDEIYVGKPWCGDDGFYVDDKAVRPHEFATKSYDEIRQLLREAASRLSDIES
jgi:capsule biosynthesis phosphatase